MADPQGRHEREEARRREALRDLEELRHEGDGLFGSALVRAGRRAADHFAARDAAVEAPDDPAELWGRRIGRALSLVAFVALCIYLYLTYLR
jgi:hypothetical protein